MVMALLFCGAFCFSFSSRLASSPARPGGTVPTAPLGPDRALEAWPTRRPLQDPHRRLPPVRSRALQRHGVRRVVERECRLRDRARLGERAQLDHSLGRRVGRGLGPGRGRPGRRAHGRRSPAGWAQGRGPGAVRIAVPPRRRVLLRHLLAGRPGRGGPRRNGPLGGLKVKEVIAAGESQSAFRMVTYINAVNPLAHVYDGFLVHSRSASGQASGHRHNSGVGDADVPATTVIRDAGVPVLTFETETDLLSLGYAKVQQPDSLHSRLWEVAGTSHADAYTGSSASATPETVAPSSRCSTRPRRTVVHSAAASPSTRDPRSRC